MRNATLHQRGLAWAALGVAGFSLTFPATRLAVQFMPVGWVAAGRGVLAGLAAGLFLVWLRAPLPARRYWGRLALIALCTVIAFPWLIAQALSTQSAGYSAILAGAIPLLTALVARMRGGEALPPLFWLAAGAGSLGVMLYGATHFGASAQGNLYLLAAIVCAAVGYAEGGRLAADLGGMRVVSWSVVVAVPFLLPSAMATYPGLNGAPIGAWLAFAYLGLVSQWLAFYPWYRGMVQAGVAQAAQMQQLQVFLTLIVSAVWLGESITWVDGAFAAWVAGCVVVAQRAAQHHRKKIGFARIPAAN